MGISTKLLRKSLKNWVKLAVIYSVVLQNFLFASSTIAAQQPNNDFSFDTIYNVEYQPGNDFVTVREKITITVNNPNYYYPSGYFETLYIPDFTLTPSPDERSFKKDSLSILLNDTSNIKPTTKDSDSWIEFELNSPSKIDINNSLTAEITYNTHELISINGDIVNLYLPGLPEDTQLQQTDPNTGTTTQYTYDSNIVVPTGIAAISYKQPSSITTITEGTSILYNIPTQDRIGKTSWLQLGAEQFYYFKLVQTAPKTDQVTPEQVSNIVGLASTNVYKIALPREFSETGQQIFIKNVTPEPSSIEYDSERNLIASFDVPANRDTEITIEGYITLNNSSSIQPTDFDLDKYLSRSNELPVVSAYLGTDPYWQSDNPEIKTVAQSILDQNPTTINQLIHLDYDFVVKRLDYDYSKLEGDNSRLGAVKALETSTGVCMEYADLLLAILRAQGIPSRAAFGYGNDPTGAENRISNDSAQPQTIGHQWVQIWIPDYGWMSVDPTWGESDRLYIGADLDHILWYTLPSINYGLSDTVLYSADPIDSEIKVSQLYLQALTKTSYEPISNTLTPVSQISAKYSTTEYDSFTFWLKTTPLGRALVITTPACGTIFVLTIVISLSLTLLAKRFKKKTLPTKVSA